MSTVSHRLFSSITMLVKYSAWLKKQHLDKISELLIVRPHDLLLILKMVVLHST